MSEGVRRGGGPAAPEERAQAGAGGPEPEGFLTPTALEERAALHHALGDPRRLGIVEALHLTDSTPKELAERTGLGSNLLAFHLKALEDVGLVVRTPSEADGRRRYVRLQPQRLDILGLPPALTAEAVLFVCTQNAARSQFAAALWERATGRPAASAGTQPASQVHPLAVATAARHDLALSGVPRHLDEVDGAPDLVVSVCDRARELGTSFPARTLHWSVPDPVGGGPAEFERAYAHLAARVELLAGSVAAA